MNHDNSGERGAGWGEVALMGGGAWMSLLSGGQNMWSENSLSLYSTIGVRKLNLAE